MSCVTVKVQGGLGRSPRKFKVHRVQGFDEKRDGKILSVTEGGGGEVSKIFSVT